MPKLSVLILTVAVISATGCASDSDPRSRADNVPVDISPDNSHNHVYGATATEPTSYRQTITDRAYDYSDPNNPTIKKGNPPLEMYSQ